MTRGENAVAVMNTVRALPHERADVVDLAVPTPVAGPPARLALPTAQELKILEDFGKVYAQSGLLPKHIGTWQAVVVTIRFGQQLGLDEFTALNNIYVINGAATCSAGLMHALILRDHGGDAILPVSVTPDGATARYKRREWAEYLEHSFTIQQARTAGLVKQGSNWEKWPDAMCWARLISQIARLGFIDSIKGLYVPEEFGYRIEPGGGLIDAEGRIVEPRPPATASVATPRTAPPADAEDPDPAMRKLHREANLRGIDHDTLHEAAVAHCGVASMKDLTAQQKKQLTEAVAAIPVPDERTLVDPAIELLWPQPKRTWVGNIRKAPLKQLTVLNEQIVNVGLMDDDLAAALEARQAELAPADGTAPPKAGPLDQMLTWSQFWDWLDAAQVDSPRGEKKALEALIGAPLSIAPQKAKEQVEHWIASLAD